MILGVAIIWSILFVSVLVFIYKKLAVPLEIFDNLGLRNKKPFIISTGLFEKKSFPEVIQEWYSAYNDKVSGCFQLRAPVFFIKDPKLVKQMAVKDFDYFVDHRIVIDGKVDKLFGRSLVSLLGNEWRDMRSTLSPMFTGSKMRMMYSHVASVGQQTSKTMKQQILNGKDDVIEFKELAMKFTVDVIASSAFGIEINSFENPNNDFKKMANNLTNFGNIKSILKFSAYMIAPWLMRLLKITFFGKEVDNFFNAAVLGMMKDREEKGITRNDMLNLLIQAKKGNLHQNELNEEKINEGFATVEESKMKKSDTKTVWSDEDLAAQAFIFFFAGFDTVGTTMGFLAYELMANPDVQDQLYEEIREMEEELDGKLISYEQIQGMKYLDQCVSETLRKWPAAPATDRMCVKDYQLEYDGKKIIIPKGISIMIPIHGYHHDPQYFPEPEKFDPDRFSPENRHNIDPDTYLPFGVGPRNCIGSRFALMEVKTIFYYLLVNFKFVACEKSQIPLQLHKTPIGLKTEKGIWMKLQPRK